MSSPYQWHQCIYQGKVGVWLARPGGVLQHTLSPEIWCSIFKNLHSFTKFAIKNTLRGNLYSISKPSLTTNPEQPVHATTSVSVNCFSLQSLHAVETALMLYHIFSGIVEKFGFHLDPQKWGQPGLATPVWPQVYVPMAVITIASARMLQKCLRWRMEFGRSVFHCSGSSMAALKLRSTPLSTTVQKRRSSSLHLLLFIVAQEEQQIFLLWFVASHICHIPTK